MKLRHKLLFLLSIISVFFFCKVSAAVWDDSQSTIHWNWKGASNDIYDWGYGNVIWDYGNGSYTYDWLKIVSTGYEGEYRKFDVFVATTESANFATINGTHGQWKFDNHIALNGTEIAVVKPTYPNGIKPSTGGNINAMPSWGWVKATSIKLKMGETHKLERITYNTDTYTKSHLVATINLPKVNYTATFDANGGSAASPATITKQVGAALGTLPTTSRTGYTFQGWHTSKSGGSKISATTTMPGGGATYYAHWKPKNYTVTYNGNGGKRDGTDKWSNTATYAQDYSTEPNFYIYTGYAFQGWNTVSDGSGTDWTGRISNPFKWSYTNNINLYAQWTPIVYKINYKLDGGINNQKNPGAYTIESEDIILKEPTRTGYTFIGWTGSNGNTPQKEVIIPSGSINDKSFTANWDKNPIIMGKDFKVIEGDAFPISNLIAGKGYITQGDELFPDKLVSVTYPVTASDAEDGNITKNLKVTKVLGPNGEVLANVDTSKIGVYIVHFSVSDSVGANVTAQRKITVLPSSTAIIKAEDRYFYRGDSITKDILVSKIAATDKYDGNITSKVTIPDFSNIKSNESGDYEITYTVTNRSHKTTIKKVIIHVIDTITDIQTPFTIRFINKDFIGTLDNRSKWISNTGLSNELMTSMSKEDKNEAKYIFVFSKDEIIAIQASIKTNGFKSTRAR